MMEGRQDGIDEAMRELLEQGRRVEGAREAAEVISAFYARLLEGGVEQELTAELTRSMGALVLGVPRPSRGGGLFS